MTPPAMLGARQMVDLRHLAGDSMVAVTELCGADELVVTDDTTWSAIALTDRLLQRADAGPADANGDDHGRLGHAAENLTAADRDRILAAVYRITFGDRIESSPTCTSCDERYELDFSLDDLLSTITPTGGQAWVGEPIALANGGHLLLPTGRDEIAVSAFAPDARPRALLDRCLVDPTTRPDHATGADDTVGVAELFTEVEDVLAAVAPTIDRVLETTCPECDRVQPVRFDLQSYVLGMILADRDRVLLDLHRLASTYGWTAEAILSLPRSDRVRLSRLVEGDLVARRGSR